MKKLMRLLALTLATAMLLSVGALAAENEDGGPRLVMQWLDWDENGRCYASDDALGAESGGVDGLGFDPTRGDCVIFFVQDGGKKTPVVPTGDSNISVIKVDEDGVASGAKQSSYYVRLEMKEFKDGEITAKYQGKTLTFPVTAELPDVGFYSTPEATVEGLLTDGYDPSQLTDMTAYFVCSVLDDPNQRQVTDVKKNNNGNSNLYDLEKAGDNVWKITLKFEDGGAWVDLDVSFREADGSTYTEERGCGFDFPQGPELWLRWLDWGEDGLYVSDEAEAYPGFQPHPGDECNLIFYTCDYDSKGEQTLTPVLPKDLKGGAGVTITEISEQGAGDLAKYFVCVEVADWEKDYTITSGEYVMRFNSNLPDIGPYSKPEAAVANYLSPWKYSPTNENAEVYMISTNTDEDNGRHLESLALSRNGEDNGSFTLEKVNNDVYKLTRKTIEGGREHIALLEATWCEPNGNTYTEDWDIWSEAYTATIASEKPFAGVQVMEDSAPYSDLKDQITDSLTLKAGESKTVYLGGMYCPQGVWNVMAYYRESFYTSDPAVKLTPASEDDFTKYTISCDVPGVYTIGISPLELTIIDASGKDISNSFEHYADYSADKGWYAVDYDEATDSFIPVEADVTITAKAVGAEQGWFPVTVTVAGEAGASTGGTAATAFSDVPAASWYAPAVSFANGNGYMNGNPDGTFNPTGRIKGTEFAQILYNKEGKPAAAEGASFAGVDAQWYAAPVLWAAGEGIITDTGDAAMVPTGDLTRQQIALMLYNYMGQPEGRADLSGFTDADKVSAWALDAMQWAVSAGVLQGSNNALDPTGTATRAQTAQILMNFFG